MRAAALAILLSALLAGPASAQVATGRIETLRPDQQRFRALYEELVETDTTLSAGDCTRAAEQLAARLRAAGIAEGNVHVLTVPEHPKEGSLVAVYPGTSSSARPILLLGHIDVVEANRVDWERDPFTLVEENGYFYARGSADDKAMSAVWADLLIRFAEEGYRPQRTVKLALTCGEESDLAFNGADWLARNRRELIDAEFALNEGGGGETDGDGHLVVQTIQVGEKIYQDYVLSVSNPGGHSSIPAPDNAIYRMAAALSKIGAHEFPLQFNDTTRAMFAQAKVLRPGEVGEAAARLAADPGDTAAEAIVNRDRWLHALLRTTCVATMVDGGHAKNALPQRVEANVNCRIFPGGTPAEVQATLADIIGDETIAIRPARSDKPLALSPALDPAIVGPMERLSHRYFPGVPVIPAMSTGATDGLYLSAVGIPTYGVAGIWGDPDGNGAHGLNERMEVRSLFVGRDYLYDLVKDYAG
ncbi:MAG TPA: M20/M25/M40 family metallo-hydrolase [Croceibacterium sp.]|nr:M20/M25/M40 family metallo-hydrolase [Croceibacterium sp.]